MVRGYTTIEQSCKLIELGLDQSTADMYYREWKRATKDIRIAHVGKAGKEDLPALSLSALLELMPVCIGDDNYFLVIEKDETYLNEPIWRISYQHYNKEDAIAEQRKALLINAAFEMVCWLIEHEYIKVNK